MAKRIYPDTNVYGRPFDDQSQPRIAAEAQAWADILTATEEGKLRIVASPLVEAELRAIRNRQRADDIVQYLNHVHEHIKAAPEQFELARFLTGRVNLSGFDALHLAIAAQAKVNAFLTCDDDLVSFRNSIAGVFRERGLELRILNPVDFIVNELPKYE